MKLSKYLFIVAILGATFCMSCTPESIEDDQTEQQIDNKQRPPVNG